MTVTQQKLLTVLKEHVGNIDETQRVSRYRSDLLETLAEIVALEREHRQAATQIQKKVSAKCEALGQILVAKGWNPK